MIGSIQPSELPKPSQTTLSVLKACSDDSLDYSEITNLVINDPQLTIEVLRMVNSAFYTFENEINSLNQAISVIGIKSLRNLCLCLSVKGIFSDDVFNNDFLNEFWTDSLFRATAAKHLAEIKQLDKDECFTAGLLQDFGLLILFYLEPEKLPQWHSIQLIEPDKRLAKETELFGHTHVSVFELLSQQWGLPISITDPVIHHHDCGENKQVNVCMVLNAADWLTYVINSENVQESSDLCKSYFREELDISGDEVEVCLSHISSLVKSTANALGMKINEVPDYHDLLKQSNVRLAKDNLYIQDINWKLQETIKERDRLSLELTNELKLATEIQQSLLPEDIDPIIAGFNIPAKQLSGDFYDYQEVADGSILFCLADVSGKGVNASLLMVKVSSLFHCLGKFIFDLEKLMEVINKELVETSIRGMFVTFICGKYFKKTGVLKVINAGHPAAVIIDNTNKAIQVDSGSIPLGIVSDTKFNIETHSLKDSVLYVFTDGLTEAVINNQMIGPEGVLSILKEVSSVAINKQLPMIKDKYLSSNIKSNDDMTMLIVNGK